MGGLVINEKDQKLSKVGIDIVKGLSKKLATLKILDILNFSRPARLTSPLSVHQCCGNEWVRTDLLEKAYQIKDDPIERMKYLFAFAVSGIHFMLHGFGTIDAHLYSINMIKGERIGKNLLKFDDGSLFTFTTFKTRINGIIMGERVYNYYGDLIIKDYKNKVECIMTLNDEIQEGMLSKLWYGKTNPHYDESIATIRQVNPKTKEKEVKAKGYASWLGQVIFDNKTYWSIFDPEQTWTQNGIDYILPSDSTKREDLIALIKGDLDESQAKKEKLEQIQRDDLKLREN